MVQSDTTKLNPRSAIVSDAENERLEEARDDAADQLLIQQWLSKKGNNVEVCEYNARTEEEQIVYHWKKKKANVK